MTARYPIIDATTAGIPRERDVFNVNGASLIKVPDWLPNPLGRYYLYFAHHAGKYIRLAYSDDLYTGWTVYEQGTLQLDNTPCHNHIASPDIHIMHDTQEIRMYYHGPIAPEYDSMRHFADRHPIIGHQRTFVASSLDGINFRPLHNTVLGTSYFRVWTWQNDYYAIGMPGIVYRSYDDGLTFEAGKQLFSDNFRHAAVSLDKDILSIYYTQVGDCPERILCSTIKLSAAWEQWQASPPVDILRPIETWEGADEDLTPSIRGLATVPVNQLRDPAIFDDDNVRYLLYSFAGEQGIAITPLP